MKVLLIGPSKVGKSHLRNILLQNPSPPQYLATDSLAIVELEESVATSSGRSHVAVEVWDVSLTPKDIRWAAVEKDAVGAVLVFDPNDTRNPALLAFIEWLGQCSLSPEQVVMMGVFQEDVPQSTQHEMMRNAGFAPTAARIQKVPIILPPGAATLPAEFSARFSHLLNKAAEVSAA